MAAGIPDLQKQPLVAVDQSFDCRHNQPETPMGVGYTPSDE